MTKARARSTFVTVVGWIFLVLSVVTALVLVLRSAAVRSFFSGAQTDALSNSPETAMNTALRFGRDFADIEIVFLALLLIPLFTFCSSLGCFDAANGPERR
jgi:hypothetical protein